VKYQTAKQDNNEKKSIPEYEANASTKIQDQHKQISAPAIAIDEPMY